MKGLSTFVVAIFVLQNDRPYQIHRQTQYLLGLSRIFLKEIPLVFAGLSLVAECFFRVNPILLKALEMVRGLI